MSFETKPLTVFMPCVQARRTLGVAGSLKQIGARLMLNGPTAKWRMHFEAHYTGEQARSKFGENVGVYEGGDIESDPPHVVVMGREDNQKTMTQIWDMLSRHRPTVLCAYSGVFQSHYKYKGLHGVIATDLPTRILARQHGVPALRFRPNFDFDLFPYTPQPPTERIILRSYINGFEWRFPESAAFQREAANALREKYGSRVLVENISEMSQAAVRQKMIESSATLHIKENEGWGWSLVETLSLGRPLIAQSGYSKNATFTELAKEDESLFLFQTPADLISVVDRLMEGDVLEKAQEKAAERIRKEMRPKDFANELGRFLEALQYVEKMRWISPSKTNAAIGAYAPNLDPGFVHDYEKLTR